MRSLSQKRYGRFFAGWAIILTAVVSTFGLMPNGPRAVFAAPSTVTVVGNLQDELGCPGDWQPECVNTGLAYDAADDVWQGIFSVPAADFEYKTALNGSWDVNYGANATPNGDNIVLPLSAAGGNTDVKFYYDDKTHWITDNFNTTIVVAPGNFQDELGCPGDWQPDCLRSWLQDIDGDGIFTFMTDALPVGSYEGKVALSESWDVNYGDGGVPGGPNIPFTVTSPGDLVVFSYDSATNIPTIEVQPRSVALVGSLQDELGCAGDWQPECAATEMSYDADDDVWQATFNLTGNFEYKVALNDGWDENYGAAAEFNGGNIALSANGDVKFYYDDKSHWITDNVNSVIATAAGSFQDELGCPSDWSPDCLRSWLQDIDGDGIYTFATASLPPGNYETKAALNESWDLSYGIGGGNDNVPFTIAEAGDIVTISYNTANNHVEAAVTPITVEVPPEIAALVTAPARNPIQNDVFYFVMPDRFANGDPSNDTGGIAGDRLDHGFDPTDKGFFHGGDLTGMTAKLDYLADMGVTSIWMTPVFKNQPVQGSGADISAGYHGYWYVDMTQFDPHFGTNAELETLIAEAHSRGIKIFFDIITNHTADVITYEEGTFGYRNKTDYPYVDANGNEFDDRDYALSGNFPPLDQATSFPYTPTFNDSAHATLKVPAWLNDPIYYHNRGNSSFSGENSLYGDFFGLDDLFTEHPDVVNGMIDIYKYWITNYDIDGFRVDTVKHVNLEFWQQFMPAILDHAAAEGKDDFFVFGEVFSGNPVLLSHYTSRGEFPAVLDFYFQEQVRVYASQNGASDVMRNLFANDDYFIDADSNAYALPTFIGNHDRGRFGYFLDADNGVLPDGEKLARMQLAHAMMYFARGVPVVYYGDEQGFVGDGDDKNARQDMFPSQVASYNDDDLIGTTATTADDNFDNTHPLYLSFADYAAVYEAHQALRTGAQLHRYSQDSAGIYAFSRIDRDEQVEYIVAFNNANSAQNATFGTDSPNTGFTAVFPPTAAPVSSDANGQVTVNVPALGFVIYQADAPLPAYNSAPGIAFNTLVNNQEVALGTQTLDGNEVQDRIEVGVDLTADRFAEVTFAVRQSGAADYTVIGVDDNAPYRMFMALDNLPEPFTAGDTLDFVAIVRDNSGNLSYAAVTGIAPVFEEPPVAGPGDYVIFHYYRPDGDYGDFSSSDFNDFWGLHLWGGALDPAELPEWTAPVKFTGFDEYGAYVALKLVDDSQPVNFIVHRGNTKDGTESDRAFDPSISREVWLVAGDANHYYSQAEALGQTVVHYNRPDSSYGIWGLHLWQDGGALTNWPDRKFADGTDGYGAVYTISTAEFPSLQLNQTLNFIMHDGQDNKDTDGDRSYEPSVNYEIWLKSGDAAVYTQEGAATGDFGEVTIHYRRCFGDYGTVTDNYADFWGLHTWNAAADPGWTTPRVPAGQDSFGIYFEVPLINDQDLNYILHRGDEKDVADDQTLDLSEKGYEIWIVQNDEGTQHTSPAIAMHMAAQVCDTVSGNLDEQRAYWLTEGILGWNAQADPNNIASYALVYAADGGITLGENGIEGGSAIALSEGTTLPAAVTDKFPHLAGQQPLLIDAADLALVPQILTGQIAVAAFDSNGDLLDATGLQIPGVLDDLYTYNGDLGVSWDDNGVPTIRVWAPTAQNVAFHLFADSDLATTSTTSPMTFDEATGVWSIVGDAGWKGQYYLYEVEVYVNSTGQVEHNMVTDPYSHSLSMNSTRTQIVDLRDAALQPAGWETVQKPALVAPEDITIYELHVRDFSIYDETVAPEDRGTFKAFTYDDSNGMLHLKALAEAGLSHLHLLPVFDIATINENKAEQSNPDPAVLATYAPDSDQQQAAIAAVANEDGFNWGYDPFHYTAPEGSYSTNPDGPTRIVEFREMVQSVNGSGMRVVMDVVYNHTAASGQGDKSVLDKIVPGYYHRLDDRGRVANSTCCANTASEHAMFEKLMIDSLVTWAVEYKVDAFRFDLMGHHMVSNMLNIRAALDELTLAEDGVDGSAIYLYGEGWDFGEVANNARGVNATQLNLAGTGIGTFSDRLRDAVRGGGCCPDGVGLFAQGFGNGLYTDPNSYDGRAAADQRNELLLYTDQIRVEMAGNLATYEFVDRNGNLVNGAGVPYGGSPAGYTLDPQEDITYVSKHDNQTLYDINAYGLPADTPLSERVRAQALGLSTVMYGQGVPFFHAGVDLLRSKSLDRDSYNSGDWFNRLDFTYQSNNFGVGLPIAEKNQSNWVYMEPLLANTALQADYAAITKMNEMFREMLAIRQSSKLFRLETAAEVQARQAYYNTGPSQLPGLIVMTLSDKVGTDLDPLHEQLVVLINASDEAQTFSAAELAGFELSMHPVLVNSVDEVVKTATYDPATGTFMVPGRTSVVFVEYASPAELIEVLRDNVEAVVAAGDLPANKANRLYAKLDEALLALAADDVHGAMQELNNFIKFVNQSMKKDGLPAEAGGELISLAELILQLVD